ncbi:MAG: hypothetical protein KDD60_06865, partial [Bdellovibrionales bacterium]|nr:hypothetical protein [Bdellovibrionales bacterium]
QYFLSSAIPPRQSSVFRSTRCGTVGRPFMSLHTELIHFERQFNQDLSRSMKSWESVLEAIAPQILHQIAMVNRYLRASNVYLQIDERELEELGYELLDLKSLLRVTGTELLNHQIAFKNRYSGHHRELTSCIQNEGNRIFALQTRILPEIQIVVGRVVQQLIPFLSALRELSPPPFGFTSGRSLPKHAQPQLLQLTEVLKSSSDALEDFITELTHQNSYDIQFRSLVHHLSHIMMGFRLKLLRQHHDGRVMERDFSKVQSQSEEVLRSLTQGLRQLSHLNLASDGRE